MKQRRLLMLAGSVAICFIAWILFGHSESDILQTREISGTLTEIFDKPATPKSTTNTRRQTRPGLLIGLVELTDGGHARIIIPHGKYSVGDKLRLNLTLYKNGDRKVLPIHDDSKSELTYPSGGQTDGDLIVD